MDFQRLRRVKLDTLVKGGASDYLKSTIVASTSSASNNYKGKTSKIASTAMDVEGVHQVSAGQLGRYFRQNRADTWDDHVKDYCRLPAFIAIVSMLQSWFNRLLIYQ